jgi:hypothetical protein
MIRAAVCRWLGIPDPLAGAPFTADQEARLRSIVRQEINAARIASNRAAGERLRAGLELSRGS